MPALSLALQLGSTVLDGTPGGGTDVWLWESGNFAMQWEAGIYIQLD